MARALIVGCGCRGQALARVLVSTGHSVRGTTRREERLADIEATGAEAALADPGKLATRVPLLEGASVICWLLAGATGTKGELDAGTSDELLAKIDEIAEIFWETKKA